MNLGYGEIKYVIFLRFFGFGGLKISAIFLYFRVDILKMLCIIWRHPWRCSNKFWIGHPWKFKNWVLLLFYFRIGLLEDGIDLKE